MRADFGRIFQLGYIVPDVSKAIAEWTARGVGPFYALETRMDTYHYRGVRTPVDLKLAFGYWGSMQVELIQQLNTADTLYSRAVKDAPGKLNHYATFVTDIDGLLTKHNLKNRIIQNGDMASGLRFVYLEEYMPGGLHLEMIQPEPGGASMGGYAIMEAVAKTWDGTRPERDMMTALAEDAATLQKAKG